MATVIRATGSKFTNPNIEGIAPFVYDGLRAAFRPSSAENGLRDLSGQGVVLQPFGSPVMLSSAVEGDRGNGYYTGLQETPSYTYMVVARALSTGFAFFIGNFVANISGASIFTGNASTSINAGCYDSKVAENGSASNSSTTTPTQLDRWYCLAATLDTSTEMLTLHNLTTGVTTTTAPTSPNSTFSGRPIDVTKPLAILGNPYGGTGGGKIQIAEALIYNRALSKSEIDLQYSHTRLAMNQRGLTV